MNDPESRAMIGGTLASAANAVVLLKAQSPSATMPPRAEICLPGYPLDSNHKQRAAGARLTDPSERPEPMRRNLRTTMVRLSIRAVSACRAADRSRPGTFRLFAATVEAGMRTSDLRGSALGLYFQSRSWSASNHRSCFARPV